MTEEDGKVKDLLEAAGLQAGTHADPEPQAVATGHGMTWLLDGFALFRQSPGMWILAFLLFMVVTSVLSMVPVIGTLASSLVSPILLAGFMVACRTLEGGGELTFSDLLAGFSRHTGRLVGIGALYLLGVILAVIAAFVVVAVFFNLEALQQAFEQTSEVDPMALGMGMLVPLLVFLLCVLPLVMAYWFAPALVILNDMAPVDAMLRSFFACLRNVLPFTVYGFVLIGLLILGAIPMLLGLLVVGPMAIASVYTAYRDIFL